MHSILRDNLLRRKPYLKVYATDLETDEFRLEQSRSGPPIVARLQAGKAHPLATRYDPVKEAQRQLPKDHAEWTGTEIILVLGLGNPEVLNLLTEVLRSGQICMAVDASFALGCLLFRESDAASHYLSRPGCHMFCGFEVEEPLRVYLESLPAERLAGLRIVRNNASVRLDPGFYEHIEDLIRNVLRARMSDLLTRFEFERVWLRNIILNSRFLPRKGNPRAPMASIHAWQNRLRGVPGVLVAAGPSLRQSLEHVRELKKRAFVLACDTAARVLLRAGIDPHGIITLDAQRHTLFHFLGLDTDAVLFADLVSHPSVIRAFQKPVVFSTTARINQTGAGRVVRETTGGTDHAEQIHGEIGSIQSGGSVATSGFDLLRQMGCDPIVLVGQDLAYTNRVIHSPGTHHTERWNTISHRTRRLETIVEQIVRKRETSVVAGLDGEPILSDYVLNLYRHWFDESVPVSERRIVNITAQGASIAHAERPSSISGFVDSLPQRDVKAMLPDAVSPKLQNHKENQELYAALSRAIKDADRDPATVESFVDTHPHLRVIARRADVYLRRNEVRLGEERSREVYRENILRELKQLERGLRPYLSSESSA